MDSYKAYEEKSWQQLRKNATSCIEQVLEATPNKTARKAAKLDELDMRDPAGEVRKNSAINSCGPLHVDEKSLDDQLKPIHNSSVLIRGCVFVLADLETTVLALHKQTCSPWV